MQPFCQLIMAIFDYDRIEEELDLVVPDAFRLFIDTIESLGRKPSEFQLYGSTKALIDGNWQKRTHWDGWKDHFLAIGINDGCGNDFFISAETEGDDEIFLMSHDPAGFEPNGSATDFFATLLQGPDESDPLIQYLLQQATVDEEDAESH